MPVVVSIAGSDCSGGAGIQADIKTCSALGVYCPTALTAVTAQNPSGVKGVEYVGDDMLRLQLEAIFESISPDAVKIGMIPCASAAEVIHDTISEYGIGNIVIDPVLGATSGGSLSGDTMSTSSAVKELLFPLSLIVTPNIPELFRLAGNEPDNDINKSARTLMARHSIRNLLVKGGHMDGDICQDTLYGPDGTQITFTAQRIQTPHTHGTGCTLSSAIACGLARGLDAATSISEAKAFLTGAIERGNARPVFPENGPLLHAGI